MAMAMHEWLRKGRRIVLIKSDHGKKIERNTDRQKERLRKKRKAKNNEKEGKKDRKRDRKKEKHRQEVSKKKWKERTEERLNKSNGVRTTDAFSSVLFLIIVFVLVLELH